MNAIVEVHNLRTYNKISHHIVLECSLSVHMWMYSIFYRY